MQDPKLTATPRWIRTGVPEPFPWKVLFDGIRICFYIVIAALWLGLLIVFDVEDE